MHGNVREWCADRYGGDYNAYSPVDDPTGTSFGWFRVFRGGGWYDFPVDCRSADRGGGSPDFRNYFLGFRVLLQFPSGQ